MRTKTIGPLARALSGLLLLAWTVCCAYPLVFSLFDALKDNKQFYAKSAWALPDAPLLWSNFTYTWSKYEFGSYFANTVVVTGGSMLLALFLTATTAYVLARFSFKGKGFVYYLYLASMTIPSLMLVVPMFFLFHDLGMDNTLSGIVLLYSVSAMPLGMFILIGFYRSLPRELEESAVMDGASPFGTFFRIMFPLALPGLITISIVNALNFWNEYQYALVLLSDAAKYTLPIGLAFMQGEMQYRVEYGPLFAGLLISTVPILLVYVLFQRRINEGIVAGAVK